MRDKHRKIIYSIALFLVLALGIAWVVLPERPSVDDTLVKKTETASTTEKNREVTESLPTESKTIEEETTVEENQAETFEIKLIAGEASYATEVAEGTNVIDAMEQIALESNLKFETRHFAGIGEFVEEIDGVRGKDGYYWFLYINGESSDVGASQYLLESGDIIEWKYKKQE